ATQMIRIFRHGTSAAGRFSCAGDGALPANSPSRRADMATKAQEFRAAEQRTAKKVAHQAALPKTSRLTHNGAHRLDRKSTHAIEETGAHHSRKSTRGSANRSKSDSVLRL